MSTIICGIFDRTIDADAALEDLKKQGLETDNFYVSPPGQHGITPIGGDAHADAGTRTAGPGAARGAFIGVFPGLAIGLIASIWLGAVTIVAGALLGALLGAIAGAMLSMHNPRPSEIDREHPDEKLGGRMIAARVDRPGSEPRAIEVLRSHGARDVRRAEGEWRNGWRDFDPRAPLAAV